MQILVCLILFSTLVFHRERESFGPVINLCMKRLPSKSNRAVPEILTAFAFGMTGLVTGIVFDIAMYLFLRKRRRIASNPKIAMIAWGPLANDNPVPLVSPGTKDLSKSKATVPIKATCLGVVNLFSVTIFQYLAQFRFSHDVLSRFVMLVVFGLYLAFHMPLVIWLTVKSNSKKKVSKPIIAPPRGLQFHE